MTVVEKIAALRGLMKARKVAALVVPSTDPHQSEYVAPRWQTRKWASGFTGSAGTLVVTATQAGVWTDGRYFIQAANELAGSGIELFKMREPGVPTVNEWLAKNLKRGAAVAFDGKVVSLAAVRDMEKAFAAKKITLKTDEDVAGLAWGAERPAPPQGKAILFDVAYAGQGRPERFAAVRAKLMEKQAGCLLLASLDDIAWLFNIRGSDVTHSPVVLAYAVLGMEEAVLFADSAKFTPEMLSALAADGVELRPYEAVAEWLKAVPAKQAVCLNPNRVSKWLSDALPKCARRVEETVDVTSHLKAQKNPVEIAHLRTASAVDGAAMVKFFVWLEGALAAGETVTEYTAGEKLAAFRRQNPACRDLSFGSICGYQANGAMMHYSATPETAAKLERSGFFLVDSGGQYFEGTIDTTRTLALGPVSDEARRDYTLVLKGVIGLSRARFLAGTTGTNLDILSRAPLWAEGIDYKCGTGHGVGFYLNVHEGPQGFSQAWNANALKPGMVVTVEPGVYNAGRYGIRTENMILVAEDRRTDSGEFLCFETLTVCPIDTAPLLPELLTAEEKAWLNGFHRQVRERLSPLLDAVERAWLENKTRPV